MALRAMPSPNGAGAASPDGPPGPMDHFANFVNKHSYVPMWLHPDLAKGVLRHYGSNGHAIVHPHPNSGYLAGGIVSNPMMDETPAVDPRIAAAAQVPPAAPAMAGIPQNPKSIFAGGTRGAAGPTQKTPVFAQEGAAIDARGGGKVPGEPPGPDEEHDTVHAMLDPGELVANPKQLRGIQVKPGKEHLLRADQKKAIRDASGK